MSSKKQKKRQFSGELDGMENSSDNSTAGDVRTNSTSISKRSGRGGIQKRVVSVPMKEIDGARSKGDQMSAPPSDSWAWRKYGQKPIKGSPYPRGYYRCSSSKGCPARKQVERSNLDPNMLIVAYTSDHNHPSPATARADKLEKQQNTTGFLQLQPENSQEQQQVAPDSNPGELPPVHFQSGDFGWLSDYEPVLEIPIFTDVVRENEMGMVFTMGEEDESLFADLGELPECSRVFDRRMAEEQRRRTTVDEILTMF